MSPSKPYITQRFTLIGGFTQGEREDIGLGLLRDQIHQQYANGHTKIELLPWDYDFRAYVSECSRLDVPAASPNDNGCLQICIAYSYGCGRGVHEFCDHLRAGGREIHQLHAVDPVIRVCKWPVIRGLFNWWALTRMGDWKCPANVDEILSYRCVNRSNFDPVGRRVRCTGTGTRQHEERVFGSNANLNKYAEGSLPGFRHVDINMRHSLMDDDPRVHAFILGQIHRLLLSREMEISK